MCILHKMQTIRCTSIVSSRRLQLRMPNMRSQLAESLQAISGNISFDICAVSGESLDAKGNHVMPCFSIIWKSKGSHLTMHLILNLSLSSIMTDAGKFILFPFKVILSSCQWNSITSQSIFYFNLICSGVNFPVILNRYMLPAVYIVLLVHNTEHLIWTALF